MSLQLILVDLYKRDPKEFKRDSRVAPYGHLTELPLTRGPLTLRMTKGRADSLLCGF